MKKIKKDKFFRITSTPTLERVSELLTEFNLFTMYNEDSFLSLGYKTLSSKSKETYKLMRSLSKLNNKDSTIEVSLEYFATYFDTTEAAQSQRIQQLVDHGLVEIRRRAYHLNSYDIIEPTPDSTFVYSAIKLIRRKRLGDAAYKYDYSSNAKEKIQLLIQINHLVSKGARHFKARSIIGST